MLLRRKLNFYDVWFFILQKWASLTERIWRISKLIPEQTKVKQLNFGTYITTLKIIILRPRTHEPPPFCKTTAKSQKPELEFLNFQGAQESIPGLPV